MRDAPSQICVHAEKFFQNIGCCVCATYAMALRLECAYWLQVAYFIFLIHMLIIFCYYNMIEKRYGILSMVIENNRVRIYEPKDFSCLQKQIIKLLMIIMLI